jgi:putative SOS response-associated peptidase YedK
MPAILERDAFAVWLDPANHDRDVLEGLLGATTPGTLVHRPVDRRVGNVRADGPGLLETPGPPSGSDAPG